MAESLTRTDSGDALSRLIQLQAGRYDIHLTWTGKGTDDLTALMSAYAIQARLSKHLYNGMRELGGMPEMGKLPEPIQAKIIAIILQAQILTDLDGEEHAKKLAAHPSNKPKGAA